MTKNSEEFYKENDIMYALLKKERAETLNRDYINNNPNEIG